MIFRSGNSFPNTFQFVRTATAFQFEKGTSKLAKVFKYQDYFSALTGALDVTLRHCWYPPTNCFTFSLKCHSLTSHYSINATESNKRYSMKLAGTILCVSVCPSHLTFSPPYDISNHTTLALGKLIKISAWYLYLGISWRMCQWIKFYRKLFISCVNWMNCTTWMNWINWMNLIHLNAAD